MSGRRRAPTKRPQTEKELLDWLRHQPGTAGDLGDDAAILPATEATAVTVDCQIAGTHVPIDIDAGVFARRLLAVNLSDIAAMGARPTRCFLALASPADFERLDFFDHFLSACGQYDIELAGGDLSSSAVLTATLTLFGERWPNGRWLRRSAATAGQAIWVGGELGLAALGCRLAAAGWRLEKEGVVAPAGDEPTGLERCAAAALDSYLAPQPQLDLGRWLATQTAAATDISDGLARDLHHLCEASGVGAEIDIERLTTTRSFDALAHRCGLEPEELVLGGGEDYVLLFTLDAGFEPSSRFGCRLVGRTTEAEHGLWLRDRYGSSRPLTDAGWDHFAR